MASRRSIPSVMYRRIYHSTTQQYDTAVPQYDTAVPQYNTAVPQYNTAVPRYNTTPSQIHSTNRTTGPQDDSATVPQYHAGQYHTIAGLCGASTLCQYRTARRGRVGREQHTLCQYPLVSTEGARARQNQIQSTAISAQFVPGMRLLVFDCAVKGDREVT
eukprot:1435934-Rhodomonas_salina.1